jgi:hypothetical protein
MMMASGNMGSWAIPFFQAMVADDDMGEYIRQFLGGTPRRDGSGLPGS